MTKSPKVLLIDGCAADSALAELALRHRCAELTVVPVRDAVEYAEQLAAGDFQAVVSDRELGWGDGLEVLRQLRRRFPRLPMFLLAARLPEGVAAHAVDLGLTAYLEKSSAGFLDMAAAVCRNLEDKGRAGGQADAESVVNALPVGLLKLNARGGVEHQNSRACELLGSGTDGIRLDQLVPGLADLDAWQRLLAGEAERGEHTVAARDSVTGRPLALWVTRRRDGSGGFDAVVEQLDTEPAAGGDLEELNAELEQLAYAVSHDLQEPLQLIVRNARLLSDRYEDQLRDGGQKFLGHLVESTERMQSMIDGVLAYSRLHHGERNLQPISVDDILDQVLENLKPQLEDAGATVDRRPLPVVRVDRFQIQQLLTNLIGNAVKFRSESPLTISIGAEDNGGEWRFAVRDNGIGFDGRFQDRIFKMFQRLHTSEEYPGTGIGLAVSKKIVEQYGGRIWAESREGEGAAFYFTLPK